MKQLSDNQQDHLAAKFHIEDTHLAQASYLAFLKIQSWKFVLRTTTEDDKFRKEADEMIENAFFQFVPNTYVLSEEGFYFTPEN